MLLIFVDVYALVEVNAFLQRICDMFATNRVFAVLDMSIVLYWHHRVRKEFYSFLTMVDILYLKLILDVSFSFSSQIFISSKIFFLSKNFYLYTDLSFIFTHWRFKVIK